MKEQTSAVLFALLIGIISCGEPTPEPRRLGGASLTQVGAEHRKLHGLVGDWMATSEFTAEADEAMATGQASVSIHPIGEHWISADFAGTHAGAEYRGVLTLGFDSRKQSYVGTYVDDTCNHLWVYEGSMNADNTILTLYAEAPVVAEVEGTVWVREVYDLQQGDRVEVRSYTQDRGTWDLYQTLYLDRNHSLGAGR